MEKQTHDLLTKLCVELGFCLPPHEAERIGVDPPDDVRTFTDAVFVAEGLDPETADRHLYRQVRDVVGAAFQKAAMHAEQAR